MNTLSFHFFPFFFGFDFLFHFTSFTAHIRLGQGLGAEHQPTECSHHKPFLFQLLCSQATAWHPQPGSFHPLQESQSCRSRSRVARGEEEEGPLPYGPLRPVTPMCFQPQNKDLLCQEQVSPSADSELGHLITQN